MASTMGKACIAIAVLAAGAAAAEEKQVVLAGAGSMIPIAEQLVKAFQARNPGAAIRVNQRTMGSTGGIKSLEAGSVGIALAARGLKPDETAGNMLHPLGRAPVVFAVHKDVSVGGLKESQICDVFAGKVTSWSELGGNDAKLTPLSRNEDDGTKEAVRTHLACFKSLKEGQQVAILVRSTAMTTRLESEPGTIGMTELAAAEASRGAFKALALDGVAASPDTVRSGKYKLVKDYAFVTRGDPQGLSKRFLEFAASPEGRKILAANGIVAMN